MKRHLLLFLLFACTALGAQGGRHPHGSPAGCPALREQSRRHLERNHGLCHRQDTLRPRTRNGHPNLSGSGRANRRRRLFRFRLPVGKGKRSRQKETDNGLVILLVTGERCIQFATGYGLEGDLPDAICKRIQVRYMNPHFSKDEWDAGMLEGVRAVRAQLSGTGNPVSSSEEENDTLLLFAIFFCCFILVPLFLWLNAKQRKRCPQCHKHKLRQISVQNFSQGDGYRIEEVTYVCGNCGNVVRKQRRVREGPS